MLSFLKNIVGTRCIFPFYHVISDSYMPHVNQVYHVTSPEEFMMDLDFLVHHFEPVSMQELVENPEEMHNKNRFHLTFDDGLREMHDVVMPLLLSKGIPATFFLNPSFIDNKDLFYRYKISFLVNEFQNTKLSDERIMRLKEVLRVPRVTSGILRNKLLKSKQNDQVLIYQIAETMEIDFEKFMQTRKPYLSSEHIQSMIKNGFTIGAHSMDHPYYPSLTLEQQIGQTDESIRFIQNHFDVPYRLFAFPFTDHQVGKQFFDYFYRENKRMDFSFGTAGVKDDSYSRNIQRIPVEDFKSARHAVSRELTEYLIKRMFNIHKIKRQ